MTKLTNFASLLAIGAVALITAPRASATAELTLNDGTGQSTQVTATSCGSGCQLASFDGALGSWIINVSTGTALGTGATNPIIDLDSVNGYFGSGSQTMTIDFSENGLTPAATGFTVSVGGTIGAVGTVTDSLYGGDSNTLFDLTQQIGTTQTFTDTTGTTVSFSGAESAYISGLAVSPYSITEVLTITFSTPASLASFDSSVDAIPEPASVLLLGTVMLGVVTLIRRRKVAPGKGV